MAHSSTAQHALITGGSSGIGFELAQQCADHGYHLILVARDVGHLANAAGDLKNKYPHLMVHTIACDLANDHGADDVYRQVKELGCSVDILINNAGSGVYGDFATQTKIIDEINMIHVNVVSVVKLTKLFIQDMITRGTGKILFTSSVVSLNGAPMLTTYAATKAFVYNFAQGLREEVRDQGITVTALLPGATDTKFFARAHMEDTKVANGSLADPADVAKAGFDALMDDEAQIVAPFKTRVGAAISQILPKETAARLSTVK